MTAPSLLIVGHGTRSDVGAVEGSGAVLVLPPVQAAARVLRDVATFDSAGVSGAKE